MKQIYRPSLTILALLALVLPAISPAHAADKPAMPEALSLAIQARDVLQHRATVDKGGHRKAAIQLLNQAIAEIKTGMAYDAKYDSGGKEGRRLR